MQKCLCTLKEKQKISNVVIVQVDQCTCMRDFSKFVLNIHAMFKSTKRLSDTNSKLLTLRVPQLFVTVFSMLRHVVCVFCVDMPAHSAINLLNQGRTNMEEVSLGQVFFAL